MRLHFQRTALMDSYQGTYVLQGRDHLLTLLRDEDIDVPEEKGVQLLADFPCNFSVVGAKAASPPAENRALRRPDKNK